MLQAILFATSDDGSTWSTATVIASDPQYAVWGPVLFYDEASGILWLFYTLSGWQQNRIPANCPAGRSYPGGSVFYKQSTDLGLSWGGSVSVLDFESLGFISKMTANPLLVTANGTWILPYWSQINNILVDIGTFARCFLLVMDRSAVLFRSSLYEPRVFMAVLFLS
jgi:hypothetical protein